MGIQLPIVIDKYKGKATMAKIFLKLLVLFVLCLSVVGLSSLGTQDSSGSPSVQMPIQIEGTADTPKLAPDFGKIPLYFIPNRGQVDPEVFYYAKASGYTLWVAKEGFVFDGLKIDKKLPDQIIETDKTGKGEKTSSSADSNKYKRDVHRMIFQNSIDDLKISPLNPTQHHVNYFLGNNKDNWRTGIPTSHSVLYKNIYSDTDLKVYGVEQAIEYDWIVKPGGDPLQITYAFEGVRGTRIDADGNLIVRTESGELCHKKPVSYQIINGCKLEVNVSYSCHGDNTFGFWVGDYDQNHNLVIDPVVLTYSTFLGGTGYDHGRDIEVDGSGCAYVAGYTKSTDFPTANAFQGTHGGPTNQSDAFVTKFSKTGDSLLYSTYLGGSGEDYANGIAVDDGGYAYVIGYTKSINFPTQIPYMTDPGDGKLDVFVTKLSPNGNALSYSTYLGGSLDEYGWGITLDSLTNAYVTGYTYSADFPTENPYQEEIHDAIYYDAFVTKINSAGTGLVYSTYLGGDESDYGFDIKVDTSGYAYVAGSTGSTNFPASSAYQGTFGGGLRDAFVTKLSPGGNTLTYSTYIGGGDWDVAHALALNSEGNAYITGYTSGSFFPIKNAYQGTYSGGFRDAFVTKLASGGGSLSFSTFLGGSDRDWGNDILLDGAGNVYVTGATESTNFPTLNPYMTDPGDSDADVFLARLAPTGSSLHFSTYLGGTGTFSADEGHGIALDKKGAVYIAGETQSDDFPTKNPYQEDFSGDMYDVFVSKLLYPQKKDLLGTWAGQGIYYRNSDTGAWTRLGSSADKITAGDLDDDGTDDLIGIWPSQGGVWVKYSDSGSWAKLSTTADWIGAGDMNGDGRDDLLGTWTGQGVYFRDSVSTNWIKMASAADKTTCGELDGDGTDDLIGIWPSQGGVWVKYSDTATWEQLSSTADWIAAGDMNGDGKDDLLGTWAGQGVYFRDTATGTWHQMSSSASQITCGDLDGDGTDDLVGIWAGQGGVWVKYSSDSSWEQLSSTADWIACGKMRANGTASLAGRPIAFGESEENIIENPFLPGNYLDCSDNGPGGRYFTCTKMPNLFPSVPRTGRFVPGPGEPDFTYEKQRNLIPGKNLRSEIRTIK